MADESPPHDLCRFARVGDRVLLALHVAPKVVATLPRREERERGGRVFPSLRGEELQVKESGEVVDEPRSRLEVALELIPVLWGDGQVGDENEHVGKRGTELGPPMTRRGGARNSLAPPRNRGHGQSSLCNLLAGTTASRARRSVEA